MILIDFGKTVLTLTYENIMHRIFLNAAYLRLVGNISVIRQSNAALPHEITPLKEADTIKLCVLLYTKYIDAEHNPADTVLNTENRIIY